MADIGGSLGLFLGASIFTLAESLTDIIEKLLTRKPNLVEMS